MSCYCEHPLSSSVWDQTTNRGTNNVYCFFQTDTRLLQQAYELIANPRCVCCPPIHLRVPPNKVEASRKSYSLFNPYGTSCGVQFAVCKVVYIPQTISPHFRYVVITHHPLQLEKMACVHSNYAFTIFSRANYFF